MSGISLTKLSKLGDWDDYLMRYRGQERMITLSNCFKLVHGNDKSAIKSEMYHQALQYKREIDKGLDENSSYHKSC